MQEIILAGRDHGESLALWIPVGCRDPTAQMRGDGLNILVDCGRVFEDGVVDSLKDELILSSIWLFELSQIGIIDMAVPVWIGADEFSGDLELGGNLSEIRCGFSVHFSSGRAWAR